MTSEEIREQFGHNVVYAYSDTGSMENDIKQLLRMLILSVGELAAQIAETQVEHLRLPRRG